MPDRLISHYRIVRKLGAGGMGEVLLARDTQLARQVALKIMSAELAQDAKQQKRFRAEAKAASGLSHPNICVIHEVGETEDGRPFLAMEFIEGKTLDAIMRQRRLKISEVIGIGIQVAQALDAAHARNLIHRDIKTANLIVDQRGQCKVLDFGLAKRLYKPDEVPATTKLTGTGILIGTPHYMSPEQVLGEELDRRSDLFSLGVVLYELVAGQRPFLGATIGELFDQIVHRTPEPLGLENPIFSPALDGIILKCLEKQRENRYPSAKALADDLTSLQQQAERAATLTASKAALPAEIAASPPAPATSTPAPNRWFKPALIAAGVVAVIAALSWPALHGNKSPTPPIPPSKTAAIPADQKSVAVLPFDNFSAETNTEYLSDGLTEEITTALARVPGLRVAARNSAFTFKHQREDLRVVGKALGVNTILEGSLQKFGSRLRVSAQLINSTDGLHLWAETYDRNIDDILAVEQDIATQIANRFELPPRSSRPEGQAAQHAPNSEAYELYLKGLHAWNKRTITDLDEAARLFREATDKDPAYAAAYAGLAMTYVVMPDYTGRPNPEYAPLARAAAERALALDPGSAEAHAVLGMVCVFNHQHQSAEQEFQKAIDLNPSYATAHQWRGMHLRWLRRLDEAGVELRRAESLDPFSPIIKINVIRLLESSGKDEEGLAASELGLRTTPHPIFHAGRAVAFLHLARCPEALAEAQVMRSIFADGPMALGLIGLIDARCGDPATARTLIAELKDWKTKGYAVACHIAWVHVGLQEDEAALDWFEQGLAQGEQVEDFVQEPEADRLRSLPRFQALLKNLGLNN